MKKLFQYLVVCIAAIILTPIISVGQQPATSPTEIKEIIEIVYPPLTEREGIGLEIPIPPKEHPRLYFRKGDIPALKAKMTHPLLKESWSRIAKSAEMVTDGKLYTVVGKTNVDLDVSNAIEAKALLYALDNNRAFGQEAVTAVLNFFRTVKFDYTKITLREAGRAITTGAMVYDWCYDLISAEEKKYLIARMETLATKMEVEWPHLIQSSIIQHGSEAQLCRDMLSCGIATYDEKPEIYNLVAGRLIAEFIPARAWSYKASYQHQGTTYGPYRYTWDLFMTLIFDKMGYPNILGKDQVKVPYYWIYLSTPDGQILRQGDEVNERTPIFDTEYIRYSNLWAGSYFNDPILMGAAIGQVNIWRKNIFEFLFLNPNTPSSTDLSGLPLTKYFPDPNGQMVARTSWDNGINSNAVVAQMKVGVYNLTSHQHLDAGNFQIYYKGPLAPASGIYIGTQGGWGSSHFLNYYQRTIAHNSMLIYDPAEKFLFREKEVINDGGQIFPNKGYEVMNLQETLANSKVCEVLAHNFGPDTMKPEYTYLKGELAPSYSKHKLESFKRSFVFLNLMNDKVPAALVVFDRVNSTNKDFKKTWLLHTVEEPVISGNTTLVKRIEKGYNGQMINTTLLPLATNLTINKVGGKGNEFSVSGKNFPQSFPSENNTWDGALWRIEVSPKNADNTDNFLNVMQVMDYSGDKNNALKVETIETEKFVGTKIGDRMVLFSKKSEVENQAIELKIAHSGITKVLITDLAIGSWDIQCIDNKKQSIGVVQNSKNLLYFNAGKGTYVITKK
ncbi:MAG: hypothetical protein PF489_10920 [Salinivirgaceae bacterium]|jgi:hypothetical protein|nr:hypothetical protein [Salinivirgaceae bacterium]